MDIDGGRWDTDSFAASDLDIIEGLAEFYCRSVCDRIEPKLTGVRLAFDRLQGWSSGPYLAYLRWLVKGHDPNEVIRTTMIQARRTGVTRTSMFEAAMAEYRRKLARGDRQVDLLL